MGCFTVAFPTFSPGSGLVERGGGKHGLFIRDQPGMTPDTVFLDHMLTLLFDHDHLGFLPECEQGGMPEAVLGFEIVFIQDIVVGHMAVIAMRMLPVRAVVPGGILWRHDVAVHAGFGFV